MKTTTASNQGSDLYTRVTERVVADLERGVRSWLKPWTSAKTRITVPSRYNGTPYRGINVLILWARSEERRVGKECTTRRVPYHSKKHDYGERTCCSNRR